MNRHVRRRWRVWRLWPAVAATGILGLGAVAGLTVAHAAAPELSLSLGAGEGGRISGSLQIVILLTILSLAPTLLIALTAFVRIVIVLSFVRQAIGTPTMPPTQVLIPVALFLTVFVMLPVFRDVHAKAVQPYFDEELTEMEALERAYEPLRGFMLRQTREKDLALFVGAAGGERPASPAAMPAQVLIPAYMISELKTAFQMGFLLFIPFLVLDMVIASVLVSMGMMMLPPTVISLPFKVLFFVLIDGWSMLAGSLIKSFS